jgi:CubicO group peptidase (beta-lactamase class C family)
VTDRTLRLRCLGLATLALFCALKLPAQQKKLDEQSRIRMESSVARFMASGSVPGVSVAVVEGGEYVGSEGFGMADLENSYPPRPRPFTGWHRLRSH